MDTSYLAPFMDGPGFTIELVQSHVPLVSCLNFASSPNAIAWFIITIVVLAFYCIFVWAWSHVSKEVSEGIPSLTNTNASPAVIIPIAALWICASLPHSAPYGMFPGFSYSFGLSVLCVSLYQGFHFKAATTFGCARKQVARRYWQLCPALATAKPSAVFGFVPASKTKDSQPAEDTAIEIEWFTSYVYNRHARLLTGEFVQSIP